MWEPRTRTPAAHLRAGDAERERVAADLAEHCAQGRLSPEELESRVELALGARTLGELEALTRDLPPLAPAGRSQRRRRPAALAALAAVLFAGGAAAAEVAVQEPVAALVVAATAAVVAAIVLAVLVSAAIALAPVIALGIGAVAIKRALCAPRARRLPSPPLRG